MATGRPSSSIVPAVAGVMPKIGQRQLGAAGADEAGDAEDLAAAELEGDVADAVAEGEALRP